MTTALAVVLTLLALEGLLLAAWPAHVKAILTDSSDKMLRIVGIIELFVVLVILAFACKLI